MIRQQRIFALGVFSVSVVFGGAFAGCGDDDSESTTTTSTKNTTVTSGSGGSGGSPVVGGGPQCDADVCYTNSNFTGEGRTIEWFAANASCNTATPKANNGGQPGQGCNTVKDCAWGPCSCSQGTTTCYERKGVPIVRGCENAKCVAFSKACLQALTVSAVDAPLCI